MWNDTLQNFADEMLEAFRYQRFELRSSLPIAAISLEEAYEIQSHNIRRRIADGETPIGYKVGCTSRAIREQFKLQEPVSGRLMYPYIHFGDTRLRLNEYVNCAVEPEFVFRIGRDITAEFLESKSIAESIDYVSPGIEVHNYKFWYGEPSSQELIASNTIHACLVVGNEKKRLNTLDLEMEGAGVFIGDELVASGIGAETMGGPLKSLAWLAERLLLRREYLKAGDLVIPGSPVRLIPVEKGTVVKARFTHLGDAQAVFF
jgi:2-keto-4-pentenoate hydratase